MTPDHPYAPYLSEHLPTEFGTLKASDGQTLYYQIIKPRDLAPGKRYPVVVDVYGGPGVQRVASAWGGIARTKVLPSIPGAARLYRVHARQPRQRRARRQVQDRASITTWARSKCRTRWPA